MSGSFTESTLVDLVTADGRSAFMLRLARHVDEGVAWLWLVTFGPEGVHGFVDDAIACPSVRTVDDGTAATYEVGRSWVRREGSADSVTGGACHVEVLGHAGADVPRGPGSVALTVSATFRPRARRAGSNLAGRSESIVDVDATVSIGGVEHAMSGVGQFHEQLQDAPRFDTPFTYLSLRGASTSLIGLRVPVGGRAVVQRDGDVVTHPGFDIDPLDNEAPMAARSLRIDAPGGPLLSGEVTPTVRYTVPIKGGRRPSAIVQGRLGDEPVTGFVNDWRP